MKGTRSHSKVQRNGGLAKYDKSVRFEVPHALWDKLSVIANAEGREQGRPKSVSAIMRRVLQNFVDAKVTK